MEVVEWLLLIPTIISIYGVFNFLESVTAELGFSPRNYPSPEIEKRINTLYSKADDWDEIGRYGCAEECRKMAKQLEPKQDYYLKLNWKLTLWFVISVIWLIIYIQIVL